MSDVLKDYSRLRFASQADVKMADELELSLEEDNNEEITRNEERFKKLSEKVKLTSKERDEIKAEAEKIKAEKEALAKEADFYKGFSKVSSKYQGASEYQDKIWEKAQLGLDVEEATMLVLAKEGKYTPPPQPEEKVNAVGGSASMGITDGGEKSLNEMSSDDKRKEIEKLSYTDVFGR